MSSPSARKEVPCCDLYCHSAARQLRLDTGLILPDDEIYIRNQLLMTMQLDSFTEPEGEVCYTDLESILKTLVDDAVARGVCEDNSTARDLFDTKLMGVLTPRPSIVRANFEERYESEARRPPPTGSIRFSQDTDYIRRYRIKRDVKWVTKTPYGDLDITINLSKPEKDPKAIAAAKLAPPRAPTPSASSAWRTRAMQAG